MSKPKEKNKNASSLLYKAILSLQTEEHCEAFFSDLLTQNEIQSFAQRLEVAKLLREGNTYQRIELLTGASTATISRVKRVLTDENGALIGVLDKLSSQESNE